MLFFVLIEEKMQLMKTSEIEHWDQKERIFCKAGFLIKHKIDKLLARFRSGSERHK